MLHEVMNDINYLYQEGLYSNLIALVDHEIPNGRLLCLTEVGSKLYGTDTEESDTDLKGVFLPDIEDVLLGNIPNSYGMYSTGSDSGANTKNDLDLEVYSLHRFFELLQKGDTNIYDILFSKSAEDNILHYSSRKFDIVYENRAKLISKSKAFKSFVGYASGQVKRYTNKGKRYHLITKLIEYIQENNATKANVRDLPIKDLVSDKYFSVIEKNDDTYYQVFDSEYPGNCSVDLFLDSLLKKWNSYGSRVKEGDRIDWKSIYHGFRSVHTLIYLLQHGDIEYPLDEELAKSLLSIKEGDDSSNLDSYIFSLEEDINVASTLMDITDNVNSKIDSDWISNFLLSCYDYSRGVLRE